MENAPETNIILIKKNLARLLTTSLIETSVRPDHYKNGRLMSRRLASPGVNVICLPSCTLDMHINGIIAYDLACHPNLEQIKRMLTQAFKKFPHLKGLIMHSDQGRQYQHPYYREALKTHGITQSMSREGDCYDNCIMEIFFGRMKNEIYYGYEKQ